MNLWLNYPLSKAVRFLEAAGITVKACVLQIGPLALVVCWRARVKTTAYEEK